MAQRDFEYNNKDVNQLNGTYISLLQDEKVGFWIGVGGFGYTNFILRKFTRSSGFVASGLSLLAGVTLQNLYTHQARATYAKVATRVNTNASIAINKLMDY